MYIREQFLRKEKRNIQVLNKSLKTIILFNKKWNWLVDKI